MELLEILEELQNSNEIISSDSSCDDVFLIRDLKAISAQTLSSI